MTQPLKPVNVVVHKPGGDVPCELVYRGTDGSCDEGHPVHVWSCPTTFEPDKGDSITMDMMPGHTSIQFGEDTTDVD
jgi:hypothetical protein